MKLIARKRRQDSPRDGFRWAQDVLVSESAQEVREDGWIGRMCLNPDAREEIHFRYATVFISAAYDPALTLDRLDLRFSQLTGMLRKAVREVFIIAAKGDQVSASGRPAGGFANLRAHRITITGTGKRHQGTAQLPLSLFAHEAAHLANEKTGGCASWLETWWGHAVKAEPAGIGGTCYQQSEWEREMWAELVSNILCRCAGEPAQKATVHADNGVFENLELLDALPRRGEVAQMYVDGRRNPHWFERSAAADRAAEIKMIGQLMSGKTIEQVLAA